MLCEAFPGWKVFTSVEHQALGCKEMARREGGKVAGRPCALAPPQATLPVGDYTCLPWELEEKPGLPLQRCRC